jgi:hypothetical protein
MSSKRSAGLIFSGFISRSSQSARDFDIFGTIVIQSGWKLIPERRHIMATINWEKDFQKALELAGKTNKPIFQDFWFDG